jgi:riboflavin kinase/FMN adenylyltransferase
VGTFDGVHLGHQKIISKVIEDARDLKGNSVIFTFEPHPQVVLRSRPDKLYLLTTLDEKLELFRQFDVDYVIVQKFDREFASIEYSDFIRNILVDKLKMRKMVLGYDAALGKMRKGTLDRIDEFTRTLSVDLDVVPPVTLNDVIINSTLIRQFIRNGFMEKAAEALGRKYSVRGLVVYGDRRGETLGYPTANILIEHPLKILPPVGVYAVDAEIEGKKYKGMMNLGYRPTFMDDHQNKLIPEVHIFDFKEDIYSKQVVVHFKRFIREEKKFLSVDELKRQLELDEALCRNID